MSDERDSAGSPVDSTDTPEDGETGSQTAVVTRPQRPTGKRTRREGVTDAPATDAGTSKNGDDKKKPKAAKKGEPRQNPFAYVYTFLTQVVAELRKVIWPNRKQMVSYTTVVLFFLAFMVALIGGVDFGFARLISLVFG